MKEQGPRVCVLKADGTNCDQETAFAFEKAGATSKIVHVNELRAKEDELKNYQILAIPGGFSYGDDIASGKILALELTSYLADQLNDFKDREGLTLGVCNGFQVLVRTGLLPFGNIGEMQATLTDNESGRFECRWINLKLENSKSIFLEGQEDLISLQVAHGEGKFFTTPTVLSQIEDDNLAVFRYCDQSGMQTQDYPTNPNGSLNAIAGITDPSGRILGLMPHPERFVNRTNHPNWRRMPNIEPQGLPIFQAMVRHFK